MRVIAIIAVLFTLFTSCEDKPGEAYDPGALPTDWVMLTEHENKLVVYTPCDAGNLLLAITKNEEGYCLLLHGVQEDIPYSISESYKHNDTIMLYTVRKDSRDKQVFKFVWHDHARGVGRWITTHPNGYHSDNIFTTSHRETDYERVDQPCRECWGDECDDEEAETAE